MERSRDPYMYRRRKKESICGGCTCDGNYARSLQGICKVVILFFLGFAWIIIAASPYWRPIFVIGGETWPFHVVMLISVCVWLVTLAMYLLFMTGYHLTMGHYNWPKIELIFNCCGVLLILLASCLEAANLWRWDMSHGSMLTSGSFSGSSMYSGLSSYGLRPGMSFTQTLNFGSYCRTRPQDCRDYFNLLAGNNTYYTNHIFGVILLFIALIAFIIATFFSVKTLRVFNRDMHRPGELPKPTLWMKFTYNMEQAASYMKSKADKVLKRGEDDEADVEVGEEEFEEKKPVKSASGGFEESRSSRSEGASSHSRSHSHHTSRSHRSHDDYHHSHSRSSHHHDGRSSRSSRHHGRSSRSSHHDDHHSSSHRSRSSSKPKDPDSTKVMDPVYEDPPPYDKEPPIVQPQPAGAFPYLSSKKGSKKGKKDQPVDMSPVASVMI